MNVGQKRSLWASNITNTTVKVITELMKIEDIRETQHYLNVNGN